MGIFKTARSIPISVRDLSPVAQDVMKYFRTQGYDAVGQQGLAGGWDISVGDKPGANSIFKSVFGLRTALKVEIDPSATGTEVKAGVGVFGSQVIPSILTWYVAWPVLLSQIAGLIHKAKLDDEAIRTVEASLRLHAGQAVGMPQPLTTAAPRFCTSCGKALDVSLKFCTECGARAA